MNLELVTVVVCSRGRPDSLAATIDSILASDHQAFELLVVEQTADVEPNGSIGSPTHDTRLRHLPTDTVGLSTARNIALDAIASPLVLFTDDDCTVPADWITVMVDLLERHPRSACVYTNVESGPHDAELGFVPDADLPPEHEVTAVSRYDPRHGIGASVGYRRQAVIDIGGFDEQLGAGARFRAGEEIDVALRLLLHGHTVLISPATGVVHHGFRTFDEGSALVRNYMYGTGACFGKLLRCRRFSVVAPFWRACVASAAEVAWSNIRRRRPPPILGRVTSTLRGVAQAMTTPVERATDRFSAPSVRW